MKVILYTGPHCELCEHAIAIIEQLETPVHIEKVNIRDSVELYHLYGARIPVIKKVDVVSAQNANNIPSNELGWPFSLTQLKAFLA